MINLTKKKNGSRKNNLKSRHKFSKSRKNNLKSRKNMIGGSFKKFGSMFKKIAKPTPEPGTPVKPKGPGLWHKAAESVGHITSKMQEYYGKSHNYIKEQQQFELKKETKMKEEANEAIQIARFKQREREKPISNSNAKKMLSNFNDKRHARQAQQYGLKKPIAPVLPIRNSNLTREIIKQNLDLIKQRENNNTRKNFAENASKHALQQLGLSNLKELQPNQYKNYNNTREKFFTSKITEIEKSQTNTPTNLELKKVTSQEETQKISNNLTSNLLKNSNSKAKIAGYLDDIKNIKKKYGDDPDPNKFSTEINRLLGPEFNDELKSQMIKAFYSLDEGKIENIITSKKENLGQNTPFKNIIQGNQGNQGNQYRTKLPNSEFSTLLPIPKSQREILGLQRTDEFLNLVNKGEFKIDNAIKQKIEKSGFSRNMLLGMVNKLNDPKQKQILLELYKRTNPDSESGNNSGVEV